MIWIGNVNGYFYHQTIISKGEICENSLITAFLSNLSIRPFEVKMEILKDFKIIFLLYKKSSISFGTF